MTWFISLSAAAAAVLLIAAVSRIFVGDGDGAHRKPASGRAARIRQRLASALADDTHADAPPVTGQPDPFAEPSNEDTITWLRRVHDEHEPPPDDAATIRTTRLGDVHVPLSGHPMVPARPNPHIPCASRPYVRTWPELGGLTVDDYLSRLFGLVTA